MTDEIEHVTPSHTIFRVVGGFSKRKVMNKYEIIPYLCIKETPRNWYTSKDGRFELQQKRTTSNSEFFNDIEDALASVSKRINTARESIDLSLEKVMDTDFGKRLYNYVYVITFKEEQFDIKQFTIVSESKKAIRVSEPTGMRGSKVYKNAKGEVAGEYYYVMHHVSQPHNPDQPYEHWVSKDLDTVQKLAQHYAEERLKYLHKAKQRCIDWVRLFEREREHHEEKHG